MEFFRKKGNSVTCGTRVRVLINKKHGGSTSRRVRRLNDDLENEGVFWRKRRRLMFLAAAASIFARRNLN